MNKSSFCSEHFAMNCKLCSDEPKPVSDLRAVVGPVISVLPTLDGLKEQVPVAVAEPPTTFRSAEGAAVISVTDQYAKSCDEYSEAVTAVTNIELHIIKLESMKLTLQHDVVEKKTKKEELRKKLLETLNENEKGNS